MIRRILRRLACLRGRHRFETLYGDRGETARDGHGQYQRVIVCIFCRRVAAQREGRK